MNDIAPIFSLADLICRGGRPCSAKTDTAAAADQTVKTALPPIESMTPHQNPVLSHPKPVS